MEKAKSSGDVALPFFVTINLYVVKPHNPFGINAGSRQQQKQIAGAFWNDHVACYLDVTFLSRLL